MRTLNYKHLHYFWVVAKSGGVMKAGERLHVTPQSISTQMKQLEQAVGDALWRRAGRRLELTDTGRLVMDYADRLFTVGEELQDALRQRGRDGDGVGGGGTRLLRVGILDAVIKVLAWRLIEPVLSQPRALRLLCREGRFNELMALLAVHELDVVIADRPLSSAMHVKGFNHLLVECGLSFLGKSALVRPLKRTFPASLERAPLLLPGGDSAIRPELVRWFDKLGLRPPVLADFDDTALMKAFGQGGAGIFPMPSLVAAETARQFRVTLLGATDEVRYQVYAVTAERRASDPAVLAIIQHAPGRSN